MVTQTVFFRKSKRVSLRPLMPEDAKTFFLWMNNPEITQYLSRFSPVSLKEEQDWIERNTKQAEDKYILALVDIKTNKLIGCMGIHDIELKAGTAITGAVIGDQSYWGKGYGTEAKMLLLDFAFHELNLRKIYSYVIAYNKRSYAYSKKCGYKEEARIPAHYYKKGKYWDQIILAVYRKEWEKLWKNFIKK